MLTTNNYARLQQMSASQLNVDLNFRLFFVAYY